MMDAPEEFTLALDDGSEAKGATLTEPTFLYPEAIMSSEWLAAHLNDPDVRIFECTMYLQYGADGVTARNARPEFDAGHIPGAGYFDLQGDLSDQSPDSFRFAMPSPDVLAAKLGEMGIGDGHRVVLYSRDTLQWSTRVWWMLHARSGEDLNFGWWLPHLGGGRTVASFRRTRQLSSGKRDGETARWRFY